MTRVRENVIEKEYKFEQLREAFAEQERELGLEVMERKGLESRLSAREDELAKVKEELKGICE